MVKKERIMITPPTIDGEPIPSRLMYLIGLSATVIAAMGALLSCFLASSHYFSTNIMNFDGIGMLIRVLVVLRVSRHDGYMAGLHAPQGDVFSVLHPRVAALLAPILPMDSTAAVVLNGVWLILLGILVYTLLWHWVRSAALAFGLTVPLLFYGHTLHHPHFGLMDLRLDILAYTIGGSAVCSLLLSNRFRRLPHVCAAGIFVTLLIYGRIFQIGLFAPACLPFIIHSCLTAKPGELKTVIRGIVIFAAVPLLLGGWWLAIQVMPAIQYYNRWYGEGIIGLPASYLSIALFLYYSFISSSLLVTPAFPFLPILYGWRIGCLMESVKSIREFLNRLHWPLLGFFIIPWSIFILLRSNYSYYIIGTSVPFYLFLFFPLIPHGQERVPGVPANRRVYTITIIMASCFSVYGFWRELWQTHTHYTGDRYVYQEIVNRIYSDAKSGRYREVSVHVVQKNLPVVPNRFVSVLLENTDCPVYFRSLAAPGDDTPTFKVNMLDWNDFNVSGKDCDPIVTGARGGCLVFLVLVTTDTELQEDIILSQGFEMLGAIEHGRSTYRIYRLNPQAGSGAALGAETGHPSRWMVLKIMRPDAAFRKLAGYKDLPRLDVV